MISTLEDEKYFIGVFLRLVTLLLRRWHIISKGRRLALHYLRIDLTSAAASMSRLTELGVCSFNGLSFNSTL